MPMGIPNVWVMSYIFIHVWVKVVSHIDIVGIGPWAIFSLYVDRACKLQGGRDSYGFSPEDTTLLTAALTMCDQPTA